MIHRDYILRMVEDFARVLAKILHHKEQGQWREAGLSAGEQIQALTGETAETICALTDTEVLGALLKAGDFQAQHEKAMMLARLLMESAEVAEAEGRGSGELVRGLRLKALHLLLNTAMIREPDEWPAFVPALDALLQRCVPSGLPLHTQGLLMQHFERTGQFARAEDALFAIIEQAPGHPALRELAFSFYSRLLARGDAELAAGSLPRTEAEAGLREIRERFGPV